jgi:hypothetical protein
MGVHTAASFYHGMNAGESKNADGPFLRAPLLQILRMTLW